jgi:hypothetical protein
MATFGQNCPAQTVHELVEYLQSEHKRGDLYRGQVREYPALIPSMFRAGIESGTADQEIVEVNVDRIHKALSSTANEMRRFLHRLLISELGIALGNIIAQQYGISSECVDLTEDLRVAAFFATRNWPAYEHHRDPGVGVVYRFRAGPKQLTDMHKDHLILSGWFQMGDWDGKYFDVFVHRPDYERESLDGDKWLGLIPPRRAVVSTLPLRMRWDEVHDLIRSLKNRNLKGLWGEIPKYDHRLTRTFRQSGGFIRPRFFWEADIPSQHHLLGPEEQWWGPSLFAGMPEFDESAPRVIPSTAIKVKLVRIENLRLRDDCEAFYFHHGDAPVTGLYRRKLWPEPSEDPLYGLLWNKVILIMMSRTDDDLPGVDDINEGVLDRGYRVAGERQTKDARELDDLLRGQLEDAREAVAGPSPTTHDWVCMSGGLLSAGNKRAAVKAAINAVRCAPTDVSAGIALAGALWHAGRGARARRVLAKVEALEPNHPDVLYNLAMIEIEDGEYASALGRLNAALESLDPSRHDLPRHWILDRLLFVSEQLGEESTASFARAALDHYMRTGGIVADDDRLEE